MNGDGGDVLEFDLPAEPPPGPDDADAGVALSEATPGVSAMPHNANDDVRSLYLTNRFNLLVCLGARLLQPRSGYRKYYPDTLTQTPGEVPLIDGPPSQSMLEEVRSSRSSFPVLIEFNDLEGLEVNRQGGLGRAVAGSVPLSRAKAIHLPDEQSLREHLARPYGNIHPHENLLQVTPGLFTADGVTVRWASDRAVIAERDWTRIDRVRGAVNAMRVGASSPRTLSAVAQVLGAGIEPSSTKPSAPWLMGLLDTQAQSGKSAEDILFSTVLTVLMESDTQKEWSPRSVIGAIEELVVARAPKRTAATVQSNLDRVKTIVEGEKEFIPFKQNSAGLTSAKAFLLVLLRERLASLVDWPSAETGADDITMQTAAVFAGALRGLSREDVKLRDDHFDDLTAEWAAVGMSAIASSSIGYETTSEGSVLSVGDHVVRSIAAPPPTAVELLAQLSDDDLPHARLRLCSVFDWGDLVTTKAVWSGPVTVQARGGKTVVTGNLESSERTVNVQAFEERLNSEADARDAVRRLIASRSG